MNAPRQRRPRSPFRAGRSLAAAASAALVASISLVSGPAQAAGNGVLDLVITAVNQADATPITEIGAQVSAAPSPISTPVTYRVQYSCAVDVCDATQVAFTPPPADPWGLNPAGKSVLQYASWVKPAAIPGATDSGNDVTGKTFNLGNLAAGTSGTFSVTYNSPGISGNDTAAGQFFPDGSDIAMSATASSDTATSKTSTSHVTWRVGTPAGPTGSLVSSATVKPDVTTTIQLAANSGAMQIFSGASIAGDGRLVAAGDYKIVYHAPAQATIGQVRISPAVGAAVDTDAVVDHVNNTVTWTKGSLSNPVYGARGAWGGGGAGAYNSGGAATNNPLVGADDKAFWQKRVVDLTFPVASFPDADGSGCNFRTAVTSSLTISVHYLDTARTAASTTIPSTSYVACGAPFGGLVTGKDVSGGLVGGNGDGALPAPDNTVFALNVPPAGTTDTSNRAWRVTANNVGNVDGTVVIDEPDLAQDHIKVNRITTASLNIGVPGVSVPADFAATVEWTDNTGATGTADLGVGESVDAAAGRWFTSAKTTALVPAGRILRTDNTQTALAMQYRIRVDDGAIPLIGERRTNTANVSISYPADADGDGIDDSYVTAANGTPLPSRQVSATAARTVQYTRPLPGINAVQASAPVIQGGGPVLPGTNVIFAVRGQIPGASWAGTSLRPQTVFVAPKGWKIAAGTAAVTAAGTGVFASVPAGITYRYGSGTFGADTRDYVVATYPTDVTLSTTAAGNWPTLSVTAFPTNTAAPGVNPTYAVWAGDASGNLFDATQAGFATAAPGQFTINGANNFAVDVADVDDDGNTTEESAKLDVTPNGLAVGATDGLSVVKQLCVPLAGAPDGCSWISGSAASNLVPADAGTVKYRIQVSNAGNTALHDVVAYDVLPHVGDTSLLAGATPRGSQFALPLASVETASAGLSVAASGSANPARPEVNPGATGTTNDWGTVTAGKKALRITVDGDLAVGDVKEVVFTTTLPTNVQEGQKACNSVAADSNETLPAEPASTCVTLDEPLNQAPTVSIASPADGAELEYGSSENFVFSCDDVDGNLVSCVGTDEDGNVVTSGSAVDTTAVGAHTVTVTATDAAGLTATTKVSYSVGAKPNAAPTASIAGPADGAELEYGSSENFVFSCDDVDGNLVSCVGTDEDGNVVTSGSAVDTTAVGAHTVTVTATDAAGLTGTTKVTYTVKRKPNVPPTVNVAKPIEGATYFEGQKVPAAYSCADADGTVVSCQGPVANGADIDTAAAGTKSFTVTATDDEGATASRTVTYKVVKVSGICRGTGLSLLGIGLGAANPKGTPCATDTDKELNVNVVITNAIPLLGIPANSVSASVITGATQSGPGSAAAQAGVASLKISILGQTIEATGLTSSASSTLSSCGAPAALSGISSLASLKINGKSIANLTQPNLTVPLIVGHLGINEREVSGNTVTTAPLHLNVLGLVDLAVGQSVAGATC